MLSRILVFCLVGGLFGCGGGPDGALPTYEAGGTITASGEPVADATVVFVPIETGSGALARGRTDANGKYTLTTYSLDDGAAAGDYQVSVTVVKLTTPPAGASGGHGLDSAGSVAPEEASPKGGHEAPEKADAKSSEGDSAGSPIDSKYGSATGSGLTATVSAGGDNVFDFAL